jgi:branched-chain amino acid transport system ATP-binding protein
VLEITGLTKFFGGLQAVSGVDIVMKRGEILGLIGPNGAGKTTFFNLVSGFIHPTAGSVTFGGQDITAKAPHVIARKGIVRTFQGDNVYPNFTVLQNVVVSCHMKPGGLLETILHTPRSRREDEEISYRSHSILDMVGLSSLADVPARNLSHGHKRTLGIAIALAAQPRLLLLDEPFGGMNAEEVLQTVELIKRLWAGGISILLIEHNMRATMSLCRRIVVLNFGRVIAEGPPEEIQGNPDVIRAYLGAGHG